MVLISMSSSDADIWAVLVSGYAAEHYTFFQNLGKQGFLTTMFRRHGFKHVNARRSLQTTANDNIFLYFIGDSSPDGIYIGGVLLKTKRFQRLLDDMHLHGRYRHMYIVMDTPSSGAFLSRLNLNGINVVALASISHDVTPKPPETGYFTWVWLSSAYNDPQYTLNQVMRKVESDDLNWPFQVAGYGSDTLLTTLQLTAFIGNAPAEYPSERPLPPLILPDEYLVNL
ncbi:unnamed protein product [Calicophoron daubneyi]|uniref:Uncharacterized protein n=1 Tax=Calicophoron daubneyi TaxID=300641 RepID=A0AAV2TLZ2_CALDB